MSSENKNQNNEPKIKIEDGSDFSAIKTRFEEFKKKASSEGFDSVQFLYDPAKINVKKDS
jgi:hypothetical protein